MTASALLLIGVHREELAFGRTVADAIDPTEVTVLSIEDGLSGRRPLPDDEFRYELTHRALYRQIREYAIREGCRLVIDLHAGSDPSGPSADVICADVAFDDRLRRALAGDASIAKDLVRVIPLGGAAYIHARTVVPREVWHNVAFRYVVLEIYLPEACTERARACELAGRLVHLLAAQAEESAEVA